ncbi:unnamed protein product [Fusarium graminearum]|nr:hypothetical protein FG05_04918 [Fusarium graminearum]CZS83435.1 unnamed protein product [Fusarium graminearum]
MDSLEPHNLTSDAEQGFKQGFDQTPNPRRYLMTAHCLPRLEFGLPRIPSLSQAYTGHSRNSIEAEPATPRHTCCPVPNDVRTTQAPRQRTTPALPPTPFCNTVSSPLQQKWDRSSTGVVARPSPVLVSAWMEFGVVSQQQQPRFRLIAKTSLSVQTPPLRKQRRKKWKRLGDVEFAGVSVMVLTPDGDLSQDSENTR